MGAWTAMVLHSTGTQGFAGYVGLYGPCTWAAPLAASDTPILLLQGGSDSSISVNQCSSYIDAIKSAGGSAELVVYPNAAHTFIHKGLPSGTRGVTVNGPSRQMALSLEIGQAIGPQPTGRLSMIFFRPVRRKVVSPTITIVRHNKTRSNEF